MPMRQASYEFQSRFEIGYGLAPLKQEAKLLDDTPGEFGEVGKIAFLDLAVFAIGFAEQHGRR